MSWRSKGTDTGGTTMLSYLEEIGSYVDCHYDTKRQHSSQGYVSPVISERGVRSDGRVACKPLPLV